jgi:hypothetical protein
MTAKQLELIDVSAPQANVIMLYYEALSTQSIGRRGLGKMRAFTEEDSHESALYLAVRAK